MPDLYWIDVETTGLDPQADSILEIAVARSSMERPFEPQFIYHRVLHFEGPCRDAWCQDAHTRSGLLAECLRSTATVADVARDLRELVPLVLERDQKPILAGSSVHFDRDALLAHGILVGAFSYRLYDVSAIYLFAQSLGMPRVERRDKPHRARKDILASVDLALECAVWFETKAMLSRPVDNGPLDRLRSDVMWLRTRFPGADIRMDLHATYIGDDGKTKTAHGCATRTDGAASLITIEARLSELERQIHRRETMLRMRHDRVLLDRLIWRASCPHHLLVAPTKSCGFCLSAHAFKRPLHGPQGVLPP